MKISKITLAATLTLAIVVNATGANAVEISRTEYGDRWPFTVASGDLYCVPNSKVVFRADGVRYAVNGTASADRRFRNIRPIWRDNPDIPGTKVNIGAVLSRGLALC